MSVDSVRKRLEDVEEAIKVPISQREAYYLTGLEASFLHYAPTDLAAALKVIEAARGEHERWFNHSTEMCGNNDGPRSECPFCTALENFEALP